MNLLLLLFLAVPSFTEYHYRDAKIEFYYTPEAVRIIGVKGTMDYALKVLGSLISPPGVTETNHVFYIGGYRMQMPPGVYERFVRAQEMKADVYATVGLTKQEAHQRHILASL